MKNKTNSQNTTKPCNCRVFDVGSSISLEVATKRIRQSVEFGKYKAWDNKVGDQKAQSIMDDFHKGLYGSRSGMWVQVNEAVELMESLYCRIASS